MEIARQVYEVNNLLYYPEDGVAHASSKYICSDVGSLNLS